MPHLLDPMLALALLMGIGAALYSSVGHAGASAYIALMALFSMPAAAMRPTALVLNIVVASLTSWRYVSAGQFRFASLWPFLAGAVPMAFVGGAIQLPGHTYRQLVGVILLISALRFLWPQGQGTERVSRDPPVLTGILCGAGIGFLAGLTGTGGGIFLSPLLIFMAWATVREVSGVAAVFILCNSIAGLAGNLSVVRSLPAELPMFIGAVIAGGLLGASIGIRLPPQTILKALGVVLIIAGLKLIGVY